MKKEQIKMAMLIVAGGVAGHFGGEMMSAFADNLASTATVLDEGVVVPYDGYLMLDSAPVNAAAQGLRFSLYEVPSGGTAQWVETQSVSVNGGKFSVALGKGTKVTSEPVNATFNEVILDAEKLYIGIEVDDGTGTFIELAGRQAIEAAPFAAWAATSADFKVERNLTVEQGAQVNGSLGVVNDVNVGGTANVNNLTATGATSLSEVLASGTLTVAGATSLAGASTSGELTVGGVLNANQGIVLGSDQNITGVDIIEGFNDLRLFGDPTSSSPNGDLRIEGDGDVTMAGDLTVEGRITTSCPGAPFIDLTVGTTAGQTRLCVYKDNTARRWEDAAEFCWNSRNGADLCSLSQIATLTQNFSQHNQTVSAGWLSNASTDNNSFYMNRPVTSAADPDRLDFDAVSGRNALRQSYCCLKMSSFH